MSHIPLCLRLTGRISQTTHAAYSVTKFAVQAFSDALRREMHPWGIKVSILEPGGFKTKLSEPRAIYSGLKQGWDELSEELQNEYSEKGMLACQTGYCCHP